jgi:hypothetical protein
LWRGCVSVARNGPRLHFRIASLVARCGPGAQKCIFKGGRFLTDKTGQRCISSVPRRSVCIFCGRLGVLHIHELVGWGGKPGWASKSYSRFHGNYTDNYGYPHRKCRNGAPGRILDGVRFCRAKRARGAFWDRDRSCPMQPGGQRCIFRVADF